QRFRDRTVWHPCPSKAWKEPAMLNPTVLRTAGRAALLAAIVAGPACADIIGAPRYTEREEKRFTVGDRPEGLLSTFDGSIEIRPSDRREVVVVIEKHASSKEVASRIEVHAEQTGNRVSVEVRMPKPAHVFGFHQSAGAKLIVSLPAASDVQAHSGD